LEFDCYKTRANCHFEHGPFAFIPCISASARYSVKFTVEKSPQDFAVVQKSAVVANSSRFRDDGRVKRMESAYPGNVPNWHGCYRNESLSIAASPMLPFASVGLGWSLRAWPPRYLRNDCGDTLGNLGIQSQELDSIVHGEHFTTSASDRSKVHRGSGRPAFIWSPRGAQIRPSHRKPKTDDRPELLKDLFNLLEAYAPPWYSRDLRNRILAALHAFDTHGEGSKTAESGARPPRDSPRSPRS